MPCCAASSRTVATRIEPVKCRCRCALGRVRDGPLALSGRVAHSTSESSSIGSSMMCMAASSADAAAPSTPTSSPTRSFSSSSPLPPSGATSRPARRRRLAVTEQVVLGRDRVRVVAADALVVVETGLVVRRAVGGVGVGHLLADPLRRSSPPGLLLGRDAPVRVRARGGRPASSRGCSTSSTSSWSRCPRAGAASLVVEAVISRGRRSMFSVPGCSRHAISLCTPSQLLRRGERDARRDAGHGRLHLGQRRERRRQPDVAVARVADRAGTTPRPG